MKKFIYTLLTGDMGNYGERWRKSLWLVVLFTISQLSLSLWAHFYAISRENQTFNYIELFSVARYLFPRFIGWGIFFSIIYAIPKNKIYRRILGILFTSLFVGTFIYESFLISMYQVLYSDSIADIMLSTNSRESAEYLRSIWSGGEFTTILLYTTLIGAITIAFAYLLHKLELIWKRWTRLIFSISLLLMCLGVGTLQYWGYIQYNSRLTVSTVRSSSIERIYWGTKLALFSAEQIEQAQAHMKDTFNHISLRVENSTFKEPIQIILILGESTTTKYMHSYGYPLQTTPNLDRMEQEGQIIRFSDVVSPAASTILSNTRSLTYYTMEEGATPWYEYPTLLGALQKAGYYTAWITAQDAIGIHSMVRTFGSSADTLIGTPGTIPDQVSDFYRISPQDRMDEQLFTKLLYMKDFPSNKMNRGLFEVLHLMGCHEDYRERYPKSFNKFKPNDIPFNGNAEQRKYIAEYLNAVYYNDYVVSGIINRYKNSPVLLFYFSDHGEVIYNDPKRPSFRGRSDKRVGVSIPFYVYMSPSLRSSYPKLWEQIEKAKDYPYETDLFTHTLTGLLGINTKYSEPRYELFSPHYDIKRARLIYGLNKTNTPLDE